MLNQHSSRSHSIFQIKQEYVENGRIVRSKLNLCDLAGSEKLNKNEEMELDHLSELKNINLSLSTLGKVIKQLSVKSDFFPYRDSKLTRLLQESFSGGAKTYLIATVSPSSHAVEETVSTLKFADRARNIMQKVKRNDFDATNDSTLTKLQKEVIFLKEVLQIRQKGTTGDLSSKII